MKISKRFYVEIPEQIFWRVREYIRVWIPVVISRRFPDETNGTISEKNLEGIHGEIFEESFEGF